MTKTPALYVLTVTKPSVEQTLTLNIVGRRVAEATVHELRKQGATVTYQTHGYALYRTVEAAIEAFRWFA